VQPVIVEYHGKAEGKFAVVNNTAAAMAVVIEPKSFSIDQDGRGSFRALDPGIHVELSAMSARLQPGQTYWVFYKAQAESYPAWFTIYSTMTQARHGEVMNVQVQLPHTVYLYQGKALERESVTARATYSAAAHEVVCELENRGEALGRVQEVALGGVKGAASEAAGFPLLPGAKRTVRLEWKGQAPPTELKIAFEHFTLKPEIVQDEGVASR
jgi:hypothetical protein